MSQTYSFIALGALFIALVLLFVYYRMEARETGHAPARRPLPGKFFIVILVACTFIGMAVTEWQGVCRLSPWGFITGIILGGAVEIFVYLHSKGKNRPEPG